MNKNNNIENTEEILMESQVDERTVEENAMVDINMSTEELIDFALSNLGAIDSTEFFDKYVKRSES